MTLSPDARAQRITARAEQDRLNAESAVRVERERLTLDRQRQIAREQAKRERRHSRQQQRTAVAKRINKLVPTVGRRVMIVGPIVAPMSVAWVGQIQFATGSLGWPIYAALLFAAAWELTTTFAGWMYHQARQDGDRGTLFRFATWLFAASAGAMNYWHALDGNQITHPTPKAVSYGAMSLVGIALWELYASLIHRKHLRERGLLPSPRPRFGAARWVRYPKVTWRAWSLSIHDQIDTVEEAWSAALGRTTSTPMASSHPAGVVHTIPEPMAPDHADQMVRVMDAAVVRTTLRPPVEATPEARSAAMDQTTAEATPETTPRAGRRTTVKGGSKAKRRTREQLRKQIEAEIAAIVEDGGEIQVKPIADKLRANRTTVRQLLDEMHIRPIRREATG